MVSYCDKGERSIGGGGAIRNAFPSAFLEDRRFPGRAQPTRRRRTPPCAPSVSARGLSASQAGNAESQDCQPPVPVLSQVGLRPLLLLRRRASLAPAPGSGHAAGLAPAAARACRSAEGEGEVHNFLPRILGADRVTASRVLRAPLEIHPSTVSANTSLAAAAGRERPGSGYQPRRRLMIERLAAESSATPRDCAAAASAEPGTDHRISVVPLFAQTTRWSGPSFSTGVPLAEAQ